MTEEQYLDAAQFINAATNTRELDVASNKALLNAAKLNASIHQISGLKNLHKTKKHKLSKGKK